ncbi:B-4DMT family transporter [Actinophytocola sp.]|uniref:B-4DMT family transporter n=1 Tax=Actinophytocola sp. TaxID=1872138 RepID=UPI002D811588|nr:B-4DMT family transporter [Actinophytocola sp.]HET9141138.1 B-4DMT family transporter [Actinophytocola sp.]
MGTWLLRGGVLAVVHAAGEIAVAAFAVRHPTSQTTLAAIVLGVLVAVAAVWGMVDRWRELARPERTWLIAALVAGWGAGVLGVIGRAAFVDQTGASALGGALTGGAAFTALLVFVPAAIGLLAGTWIRPGRRSAAGED